MAKDSMKLIDEDIVALFNERGGNTIHRLTMAEHQMIRELKKISETLLWIKEEYQRILERGAKQ